MKTLPNSNRNWTNKKTLFSMGMKYKHPVVRFIAFIALGSVIYYGFVPAINSLDELTTKECVTSSDCKRLFPNDIKKQHCEVGIYKCVYHCSPTRHETLITKYPKFVQDFVFETSDVWKKLNVACKFMTTVCGALMAWLASWYSWVKLILKSPIFIFAVFLSIPMMQHVVKMFIPHEWIDFVLTTSIIHIQKFKQSLNLEQIIRVCYK